MPQRIDERIVRSIVPGRIEDRLQSIAQQIISRTYLERVILDFNLYPDARKTGVMEDIVERMRQNDIKVEPVKGDAFKIAHDLRRSAEGDAGRRSARRRCSSKPTGTIVSAGRRHQSVPRSQLDDGGAGSRSTRKRSRNTGSAIPASCRRRSTRTCR